MSLNDDFLGRHEALQRGLVLLLLLDDKEPAAANRPLGPHHAGLDLLAK